MAILLKPEVQKTPELVKIKMTAVMTTLALMLSPAVWQAMWPHKELQWPGWRPPGQHHPGHDFGPQFYWSGAGPGPVVLW